MPCSTVCSCRLIRHSTISKGFASEVSTYFCTVWPPRRAERRHCAVLATLLRKHLRTKTNKRQVTCPGHPLCSLCCREVERHWRVSFNVRRCQLDLFWSYGRAVEKTGLERRGSFRLSKMRMWNKIWIVLDNARNLGTFIWCRSGRSSYAKDKMIYRKSFLHIKQRPIHNKNVNHQPGPTRTRFDARPQEAKRM
jgi:hypothetical protein